MLTIIGVGIVMSVLSFYSQNIDVRKAESEVLTNKILGCLVSQGKINQDFFQEDFDIFKNCSLDKDIINEFGVYFMNITVEGKKSVVYGSITFEKDCDIEETVASAEYFPRCTLRELIVLDKDNNELKLRIRAGSNYRGGNLYGKTN